MKIIYGPRRSGKTTQLIRMAHKHWYYIVVKDMKEARRVSLEAEKLEFKIPFPITYKEFLGQEFYKNGIKGFLIDNADILLQQLAAGKLEGYSFTN